jgi:hypothetical protein
MYFFKKGGKQILDLRGDLVLTHNYALVKGRVKSAAPASVRNAKRIEDIPNLGFWGKVKASRAALKFIWGPSQALTAETIETEGM